MTATNNATYLRKSRPRISRGKFSSAGALGSLRDPFMRSPQVGGCWHVPTRASQCVLICQQTGKRTSSLYRDIGLSRCYLSEKHDFSARAAALDFKSHRVSNEVAN